MEAATEIEATPEVRATVPRRWVLLPETADLYVNVTFPVGVPEAEETVAVKRIVWSLRAGFGDAVTPVEVATDVEVTVNTAAEVVAEPTELVNTASYRYAFCDAVTPVSVSVVDVAPAMLA